MPHSGPHFLRFWCDLVSKSLILGAPWRPAGPKMAPKIDQMEPKCRKKIPHGAQILSSWNRPSSKIVFGVLFGTILVDLGSIFRPFRGMCNHFGSIFDKFPGDHFAHH